MSNRSLMEQVLHDLLPDLMAVHQATKHQRTMLKIEKYVERISEAWIGTISPTNSVGFFRLFVLTPMS